MRPPNLEVRIVCWTPKSLACLLVLKSEPLVCSYTIIFTVRIRRMAESNSFSLFVSSHLGGYPRSTPQWPGLGYHLTRTWVPPSKVRVPLAMDGLAPSQRWGSPHPRLSHPHPRLGYPPARTGVPPLPCPRLGYPHRIGQQSDYLLHDGGMPLVSERIIECLKRILPMFFFVRDREIAVFSILGSCPEPEEMDNAVRSVPDTHQYIVGTNITYTCDQCYTGGGTSTCQCNTEWSPVLACTSTCRQYILLM